MTDNLAELMRNEVADVSLSPDAGPQAIRAVHRKHRRKLAAAGAGLALATAGAVAVPLATSSPRKVNEIVPITTGLPTSKPDPLESPVGLPRAARTLSRAYPVGTTSINGQARTLLLYWTDWKSGSTQIDKNSLCLAAWIPGTALSSATLEACSGPFVGSLYYGTNGVLISWEDGSLGMHITDKTLIVLDRRAARAELLLALDSDLPATADSGVGHPPVRKTQQVTLVGRDQPNAPYLLGLAPRAPKGYTYVGEKIWDSDGKLIWNQVHGWHCGPASEGNTVKCR